MRQLSTREHVFAIAALLILSTVAYLTLRARPTAQHIDALDRQAQSTQREIDARDIPERIPESPEQLQREIDGQTQRIAAMRRELAGIKAQFVTSDSPAQISALRLALSELAEQSGVSIEAFRPVSDRRPGDAVKATRDAGGASRKADGFTPVKSLDAWLLQRPRYEMQLTCGFAGLQRLINAFDRLPQRVIVTDFHIEQTKHNRLKVRLILGV